MADSATTDFPSASWFESVRFNLVHIVPALLQGIFTRRPGRVARATRLDVDGRAVRLCRRLKRKYGEVFYLRVMIRKALFVASVEGLRHVLAHSPEIYGPPEVKKKGMARFQPGAVTLSEGEVWRKRRHFNEEVLETGRSLHQHAGPFLTLIREEVASTLTRAGATLGWAQLAELFERITLGIVFGSQARGQRGITTDLKALMEEANPPTAKGPSEVFERFEAALAGHLASPAERCLAARATHLHGLDPDEHVRPNGQIPHWLFAMKDTLSANTARALALITSHPAIAARVRAELAEVGAAEVEALRAESIVELHYLGGVIHEAMRLWPTTPLLSRIALRDDEIDGRPVAAGTQILIFNTFNHRDTDAHPDADFARPERWLDGAGHLHSSIDIRFNHLSHGTQVCAGIDLALFIARSVLAALLASGPWRLESPPSSTLDPGSPLPHMLDFFTLGWQRQGPGSEARDGREEVETA